MLPSLWTVTCPVRISGSPALRDRISHLPTRRAHWRRCIHHIEGSRPPGTIEDMVDHRFDNRPQMISHWELQDIDIDWREAGLLAQDAGAAGRFDRPMHLPWQRTPPAAPAVGSATDTPIPLVGIDVRRVEAGEKLPPACVIFGHIPHRILERGLLSEPNAWIGVRTGLWLDTMCSCRLSKYQALSASMGVERDR